MAGQDTVGRYWDSLVTRGCRKGAQYCLFVSGTELAELRGSNGIRSQSAVLLAQTSFQRFRTLDRQVRSDMFREKLCGDFAERRGVSGAWCEPYQNRQQQHARQMDTHLMIPPLRLAL
jgi:hypothetical protein